MTNREFLILTQTATYRVAAPYRIVASFWALWLRIAGLFTLKPTATHIFDLGPTQKLK